MRRLSARQKVGRRRDVKARADSAPDLAALVRLIAPADGSQTALAELLAHAPDDLDHTERHVIDRIRALDAAQRSLLDDYLSGLTAGEASLDDAREVFQAMLSEAERLARAAIAEPDRDSD